MYALFGDTNNGKKEISLNSKKKIDLKMYISMGLGVLAIILLVMFLIKKK